VENPDIFTHKNSRDNTETMRSLSWDHPTEFSQRIINPSAMAGQVGRSNDWIFEELIRRQRVMKA